MKIVLRFWGLWLLCIISLSTFAQSNAKSWATRYMQLNPIVMDVYNELDSIFPLRYLANESPADCAYWVNYTFSSPKEFELYRPWLETLLKRLEKTETYTRKILVTDSLNRYERAVQLSLVTPNHVQKDYCYLYVKKNKVSFFYQARIDGESYVYNNGPSDPNGQPRQDIADNMDALLNQYINRKNVRKEAVDYDPHKCNYRYLSFLSNNNRSSHGFRYIVPNCTSSDYRKFRDAIRSYSRKNPVRTSCNDMYWRYDESAICIFRPNNPNPLMIAAALKGTDLYLLRIEGENTCFLPRAWAEENPVWIFKDIYESQGCKPLLPPVVNQ